MDFGKLVWPHFTVPKFPPPRFFVEDALWRRSPDVVGHFRRPLIPCLIAYMIGLWLTRELSADGGCGHLVIYGAFGGAALLWTAIRRETTPLVLMACLFAGLVRMSAIQGERELARHIVRELDTGTPRPIQGTIAGAREDDPFERIKFTLRDVTVTSGSVLIKLPGFVDVTVPARNSSARQSEFARNRKASPTGSENRPFSPGERLRLLATVSEPKAYWNFFGHNHLEYLENRRIYATAQAFSEQLIRRGEPDTSWRAAIPQRLTELRRGAKALLQRHMPEHEALLMEVLLFNDMRLLSDEDERIFRDSGTMHLFAVSGTHIALLAMLLIALFRAFRLSPRAAWSSAAVLLFFYVWLLDFSPPAFRSLMMLGAFVAGKWLGREVDGLSSLAFGVALILLLDPNAAWQAGFLLSLMGVAAILLFVPLGRDWCARWLEGNGRGLSGRRMVLDGLIVTLAVALVLLPLQFFFFSQLNLLSPAANLLEGLLAGAVLASGVAVVAGGVAAPFLGDLLGTAAAALMKLSWLIAEVTADQTWALIRLPEPPLVVLFGYYGILFSGYYLVRRDTPEFRPKSLARLTLHAMAAIGLLFAGSQTGRLDPPLRIWFFDVGQGDSTLVQFPTGQTLLVDAGHVMPDFGRMVVGPQLRGLGFSRVDEAIATHADADHIGGLPWLIRQGKVGKLISGNGFQSRDELVRAVDEACSATQVRRGEIRSGPVLKLDEQTSVEVLNPTGGEPESFSDNDRSVVLRIRHGRFSCLLMADAEAAVEERLLKEGIEPCDVLKVGHHGSRTSSGAGFLEKIRPRAAVISCGRRNRYGHPALEVLRRLEGLRTRVYRTDRHGAVLVESDGETFSVTTVRGRRAGEQLNGQSE